MFLQPDGRVLEYFTAEWQPQSEQLPEPGHMAEWIWLLDCYHRATGADHGVDLLTLWVQVLAGRDKIGLVLDQSECSADTATRRLWPQTELMKASLVIGGMGEMKTDKIWDRLYADYLDTPVPGGWYDKRQVPDGTLLSTDMPSSTFYHLFGAARAYLDADAAHQAKALRRQKQRTALRDALDPAAVRDRDATGALLRRLGVRVAQNLGFSIGTFEAPLQMSRATLRGLVEVGAYTTVTGDCQITNTDIGRFTSIAPGLACGMVEHPQTLLSSHSFAFGRANAFWGDPYLSETRHWRGDFQPHGRTVIGNDVFLGAGVFVRRGVTIGDGAVVGAGSVVVDDVPPYAVVAGAPARQIRQRFPDAVVEQLLATAWWERDLRHIEGLDMSDPAGCAARLGAQVARAPRLAPERYRIEEIAKDRFTIVPLR